MEILSIVKLVAMLVICSACSFVWGWFTGREFKSLRSGIAWLLYTIILGVFATILVVV